MLLFLVVVAGCAAWALAPLDSADVDWNLGYDRSPRHFAKSDESRPPDVNDPWTNGYGFDVRRISAGNRLSPDWVRHEYSRRQAFNADDTRLLMLGSNGIWHIYAHNRDGTVEWRDRLPAMREPNWHPDDPDRLWYFAHAGDSRITELNVQTGAQRVAADFAGRLPWPVRRLSTREEGEPSADGRIWCLLVQDERYQTIGMFAYDMSRDRVLGTSTLKGQPDHVSTSASGDYCVASGDLIGGTFAYPPTLDRRVRLHPKSEHSDVALDADGRDVLVYIDYQSGWVTMVDMATARMTQLARVYEVNGSAFAGHISGNSYRFPGWVVLSTYKATLQYGKRAAEYGELWGQDRLALIELKSDGRIVNLGYMNSRTDDYWSEPQASVNRDLTRILYASNWLGQPRPASYLLTLDPGSLASRK